MRPFWYTLIPAWATSWLVELASGLLAVAGSALVVALLPLWLAALLGATCLSIAYEAKADPNGWSVGDLAQREVGIVLGVLLLTLL